MHVRSSDPCTLWLPGASAYQAYGIDYWNMRRAPLSRCARGPTVIGPAALEALNLSGTVPYVVELSLAPENCGTREGRPPSSRLTKMSRLASQRPAALVSATRSRPAAPSSCLA
eukprot:scaffold74584_cov60-Phaeocystis_antarctica.AAC.1